MCKKTYIECSASMCRVNSYKTENFDYYNALSLATELRCLNCTYLWLLDRWANHLLGPPVIDAKAGAVSQRSCVPPSRMSMVAGRTSRSFRYTLLYGGELADGVDHHVVHARGKAGIGEGYDTGGRQHYLETLCGAGPQAGILDCLA